MRQVVNFFITGVVLWAAARLFPDYVQINGWSTLVLATLLIYVIGTLLALAAAVVALAVAFLSDNIAATLIVGVAIFALVQLLTLVLLDRFLSGFTVVGFWPKVLLATAISALTISAPKQQPHQ